MSETCEIEAAVTGAPTDSWRSPAALTGLASGLLAACGGSDDSAASAADSQQQDKTSGLPGALPAPSAAEAARFLAQASMGASRAQIARVQALGYAGWLDEQFDLAPSPSRWDTLVAEGYTALDYRNSQAGFDSVAWRKLLASPDTLRQRITLALSEIFVVSIDGLGGAGGWKQFSTAAYLDLLEAGAFGSRSRAARPWANT